MPRPHNPDKIRVLLVDDHPVVLTGLATSLQQDPEMLVVGMAKDGETALELLDRVAVNIVLLDLRMPGRSGLDVLRDIGQFFPGIRVIIFSGFQFDEEIHQAVLRGATSIFQSKSWSAWTVVVRVPT
jgi:two-component system, NarL family, response regulator